MSSLTALNTLGLTSQAQTLLVLNEINELEKLRPYLTVPTDLFVLGGGSNLVLAPQVHKNVLRVATRGISIRAETAQHYLVEAAAGESWHGLVTWCVERGLGGVENLALIPGTVGAAPVQNIGAYGVELDQRLHQLQVYDLQQHKIITLTPAECGFSYRHSMFKASTFPHWIILSVTLALPKQWRAVLSYPDLRADTSLANVAPQQLQPYHVFEAVCRIRQRKLPDPLVLPNAGSFFKNPVVAPALAQRLVQRWPELPLYPQASGQVKLAAGWLIDQLGWKGKRVGPVGMHERQALVLVNYGQATADDVQRLATEIKQQVAATFGVHLEQEPVNVG